MSDEAKEKCGVFGIWGAPDSAARAYIALYALQHRGQESAGIAVSDGLRLQAHVGMGLVAEVFDEDAKLKKLLEPGVRGAIGHNRYSTTGGSQSCNAQPILETYHGGQVAVGHNGNIVNALSIRRDYERRGHIFHTTTDTEVILHVLASLPPESADPLGEALAQMRGAFSVVFLFNDRIEVARDPWGWRPLVLGRTHDGYDCVASETVALDALGAEFVREVEPGELITLSDAGVGSRRFTEPRTPAHCIFEHIYFANPSSQVFGQTVQLVRERLGEALARESHVAADCVVPMPDSGRPAAYGYAQASGIPYREGIVPNRYVGRTFIKPSEHQRSAGVQLKHNVVGEIVAGKRLVVVDDSIVRGTTTRGKMQQLRRAGAKEIHLRISCPPIRFPCYFGIDFPDPEQLIANRMSIEAMEAELGVDSLRFLSIEGMLGCVNRSPEHYCTACFSGVYPIRVATPIRKLEMEQPAPNVCP